MRELTMTDAQLQKLVGSALRKKLRAAGFVAGMPSDENDSCFFPINLEVPGLSIVRHEDGFWTFSQEDPVIAGRLMDTNQIHGAAIDSAAQQFFNKGT
jgi:hypothetical protein